MPSSHIFLLLLTAHIAFPLTWSRCTTYDHQTDTYYANDMFSLKTCSQSCTITPFFSPDNALEAHMKLINEAQESITIANPTFESWFPSCTHNHAQCGEGCTGCDLSHYRNNESFPVFAALLNAINLRKISVRILTNNYSNGSIPTCPDKATLLDWLVVNKASVRMYKTTSFLHAKYIVIDEGRKTLISSVNFSKTSFMKNRESGVIISQCDDCEVVKLYQSVFESDWAMADTYHLNSYTDDQIKIMTNPQPYAYPIVTSPSHRIKDINTTMELQDFDDVQISGYVAPDNARDTFTKTLQSVQSKLVVHLYAIFSSTICNKIVKLKNSGINVTMLVSSRRAGPSRYSKKCYENLTENGILIRKSNCHFMYSHQKYWIVDDKEVHLSTGNWAESDFPRGKSWSKGTDANRDMLVIMRSPSIVRYFGDIFKHDYTLGNEMDYKCNKTFTM